MIRKMTGRYGAVVSGGTKRKIVEVVAVISIFVSSSIFQTLPQITSIYMYASTSLVGQAFMKKHRR